MHIITTLTDWVKYGILPLIFPRKNFKLGKVLNGVIPTLDFYLDKPNRIQEKLLFLKDLLMNLKKRYRIGNLSSTLEALSKMFSKLRKMHCLWTNCTNIRVVLSKKHVLWLSF